jgi:hypothetical protein
MLPPPQSASAAAAAMEAAGIKVEAQPRLAPPTAKQANPAWIQF